MIVIKGFICFICLENIISVRSIQGYKTVSIIPAVNDDFQVLNTILNTKLNGATKISAPNVGYVVAATKKSNSLLSIDNSIIISESIQNTKGKSGDFSVQSSFKSHIHSLESGSIHPVISIDSSNFLTSSLESNSQHHGFSKDSTDFLTSSLESDSKQYGFSKDSSDFLTSSLESHSQHHGFSKDSSDFLTSSLESDSKQYGFSKDSSDFSSISSDIFSSQIEQSVSFSQYDFSSFLATLSDPQYSSSDILISSLTTIDSVFLLSTQQLSETSSSSLSFSYISDILSASYSATNSIFDSTSSQFVTNSTIQPTCELCPSLFSVNPVTNLCFSFFGLENTQNGVSEINRLSLTYKVSCINAINLNLNLISAIALKESDIILEQLALQTQILDIEDVTVYSTNVLDKQFTLLFTLFSRSNSYLADLKQLLINYTSQQISVDSCDAVVSINSEFQDIDECTSNISQCTGNRKCINVFATYQCLCPIGFGFSNDLNCTCKKRIDATRLRTL